MTPDQIPNERVLKRTTNSFLKDGLAVVNALMQAKPWYATEPGRSYYVSDLRRLSAQLPNPDIFCGSNTYDLYAGLNRYAEGTLRDLQGAVTPTFASHFLREHPSFGNSNIIYRYEIEQELGKPPFLDTFKPSIYKTGVRFARDKEILYGLPDFFVPALCYLG